MTKLEAVAVLIAIEGRSSDKGEYRKTDWGKSRKALIVLGFTEEERKEYASDIAEFATYPDGQVTLSPFQTEKRW